MRHLRRLLLAVPLALAIGAPVASASGYLHVAEARLITAKLAVGLQHREHAHSYAIAPCTRDAADRLHCKLSLYGIPSNPPEVCTWNTAVTLTGNAIAADTGRGQCVGAAAHG